jgi:GxxExxY protein
MTAEKIPDHLTYDIIGAAQKVHAALGMGFPEALYHTALCRHLMEQKISFESQKEFEVYYNGYLCGTFRPDLVVNGQVIVELKAVESLCAEHRLQTISYLKASGLSRALLLNFGSKSLEVRRLVNSKSSA